MSSKKSRLNQRKLNSSIRKMEKLLRSKDVVISSSKKMWIARNFAEHFEVEPPKVWNKKSVDKWAHALYCDPDFTLIQPNHTDPNDVFKKKHVSSSYFGGGKVQRKVASDKIGNKVYLILCWKGKEKFLKVGMTQGSLETRFRNMPYQWKELSFTRIRGDWMYEYEQAVHGLLKEYKYRPSIKFGGYTECYTMDAKNTILTLLG